MCLKNDKNVTIQSTDLKIIDEENKLDDVILR